MSIDAVQDVSKPGARVDVVQLGGRDERIHRRGAFAAAVGSGEQPCLAAECDAAQCPFSGVVKGHAASRHRFPIEFPAIEMYRWAAGIGVSGA